MDKSERKTLGNVWKQKYYKQKVGQIKDTVVCACNMNG
jgi:hypothetical protein